MAGESYPHPPREAIRPGGGPLLGSAGDAKHPRAVQVPLAMQAQLRAKLESIRERHEELGEMICDPEIVGQKQRFLELAREHADLSPLVAAYARLSELERQL